MRKAFAAALLLCFFTAQGQKIDALTINGISAPRAPKIALGPDGSVFLTATGEGFLACWPDWDCPPDLTLDLIGGPNAFVLKYDSSLVLKKAKSFPPQASFDSFGFFIKPTADGGAYLVHSNAGVTSFYEYSYLTRLDANLEIVWQKLLGPFQTVNPLALETDANGNALLGWSSCDKTLHIDKYAPNGQLIWASTGTLGECPAGFMGLAMMPDGNVAFLTRLAEGFISMDAIQYNSGGTVDILGILDGTTGAGLKHKFLFGGTPLLTYVSMKSLSCDLAGRLVVSFSAGSPVKILGDIVSPDGNNNLLNIKFWAGVAIIEPDLSLKNVLKIALTDNSDIIWPSDAKAGSNGEILVAGQRSVSLPTGQFVFNGTSVPYLPDKSSHLFLTKFDASGNLIWAKQFGSRGIVNTPGFPDAMTNIVLADDGQGFVSGIFEADTTLHDGILFPAYKSSVFVLRFSATDQTMRGQIWVDLNKNGLREASEPPFRSPLMGAADGRLFGFGGTDGVFELHSPPTSTDLKLMNQPFGFSVEPASRTVQFLQPLGEVIDSLDFRLVPDQDFSDLNAEVTPLTLLRASKQARWRLRFQNIGTQAKTIEASAVFSPLAPFSSASEPPASVVGNTVKWIFPNVGPMDERTVEAVAYIETGAPAGADVITIASITPPPNDTNTDNNEAYSAQKVISSFDPNDKMSWPSGPVHALTQSELLDGPFDFLVRFQNTGTDTAFRVVVIDSLSPFLDEKSLAILDKSHHMTARFSSEHAISFIFDNILLPDSTKNEKASHGFVRFSLRPKMPLAVGDTVKNRAAIYFDYNVPVLTNWSEFYATNTNNTHETAEDSDIQLIPNPSDGQFVLNAKSIHLPFNLSIFNQIGQLAFQKNVSKTSSLPVLVDASRLAPGLYFFKLKTFEGRVFSGKLVIE